MALGDWSRLDYQHILMSLTANLAAKCNGLKEPLLIICVNVWCRPVFVNTSVLKCLCSSESASV